MNLANGPHIPVLLDEVVAALNPVPGSVIIDATFGAGGYTRALLDRGATVPASIAAATDSGLKVEPSS